MIAIALKAGSTLALLKRIPWQVHAALALILALFLLNVAHGRRVTTAYNAAYRAGVAATVEKFRVAQAAADTRERVKVLKTVTEQGVISKEKANAFVDDSSDIDARADNIRLRYEAADRKRAALAVDQGATRGAAPHTCPAPAQNGLSWGAALPLMTQAAKNLAQLNAILDWDAAQQALADAEAAKDGGS